MTQKTKIFNLFILLGLLLAPIVLYAFQFGLGTWQEHDDWAVMGSALGGLYSPIIALLAFIVLSTQVHAQLTSEARNVDMLFVQGCKDDIEFSINRLASELNTCSHVKSESLSSYLLGIAEHCENSNLSDFEAKKLLSEFNLSYPKVLPLWSSVNSNLVGLGSSRQFPYPHNFIVSQLKVSGVLSPKTCRSLDMLLYFTVESSNPIYFWEKTT